MTRRLYAQGPIVVGNCAQILAFRAGTLDLVRG
jgi:hypothetical protein